MAHAGMAKLMYTVRCPAPTDLTIVRDAATLAIISLSATRPHPRGIFTSGASAHGDLEEGARSSCRSFYGCLWATVVD